MFCHVCGMPLGMNANEPENGVVEPQPEPAVEEVEHLVRVRMHV
jgi:hypothetical protein